MRSLAAFAALLAVACAAKGRETQLSAFCRRNIYVAALPSGDPNGRWSVALDAQGEVLGAHEARFRRLHIEPNGEAWAGVTEQCAGAQEGVDLDPEAGSLHAWVADDAAKDRWVATLCRAIEDTAWLDRCLAKLDRSKLDD